LDSHVAYYENRANDGTPTRQSERIPQVDDGENKYQPSQNGHHTQGDHNRNEGLRKETTPCPETMEARNQGKPKVRLA
jgi:hypothetical protein